MTLATRVATVKEAKDLTGRIKGAAGDLWALLGEAHKKQVWKPLGYNSWAAYTNAEFDMTKRHANRLIAHAEVVKAIELEVGPQGPTPYEKRTRGVAQHIPEFRQTIRDEIRDGNTPEEAVELAITSVTGEPEPDDPLSREDLGRQFIRAVGGLIAYSTDYLNQSGPVDRMVDRMEKVARQVVKTPGLADSVAAEGVERALRAYVSAER
jgi:hypothetical protein